MASTFSAPTNFELIAAKSSMDPNRFATLKNFKAINIGDLRNYKTQKIANSKT